MKKINRDKYGRISESRFPPSLFVVYLGTLLLMSGIHTGLLVFMDRVGWNGIIQSVVPILYWGMIAVGLTLFARREIRRTYEKPMHMLAEAAGRVADGDFSVYIPATHTSDKLDYLDIMIMDFNRMVEELGSIETLKTDFISNVSHEMKTPIAIIKNYAELLQAEHIAEEQRKEYAKSVENAAARLSDLMGNILKLNKLENQRITPDIEVYDVCRQLCECVLQFEESWDEKEIELETEIEDVAMIKADASLVELVWNNLLSNAVKFTEPGGQVTVRQTSDEKQIRISVSDTGCGMSRESMEHIFDKFYQGDTSHAKETDLGLPWCRGYWNLWTEIFRLSARKGEGVPLPWCCRRLTCNIAVEEEGKCEAFMECLPTKWQVSQSDACRYFIRRVVMEDTGRQRKNFVGYEYKEIIAESGRVSFLLDGYECFGWELDESLTESRESKNPSHPKRAVLHLKRNRKIINKMELTRLQRNFEACVKEIEALEKSRTSAATIYALVVGITGTAFMAGSVFAVTAQPPYIILSIFLAVPAFIGWIIPYFLYRRVVEKQTGKLTPLIEQKYDEIYEICEKGNKLLY